MLRADLTLAILAAAMSLLAVGLVSRLQRGAVLGWIGGMVAFGAILRCRADPATTSRRSRVQFYGRYGTPGRERQRFRCLPRDGAAHTFTEPLPRLVAGHGDCVECERSIDAHQGPQAPRCYRFPAREIARTLVGLGQGQTYRQAAERARERLAGGGESRHGQLTADCRGVRAGRVRAARADVLARARDARARSLLLSVATQRHAGAQLLRMARPLRARLRRRAA
jgi:hypothetical protein